MIAAYPRRLVIYGYMSFPDLNMPPPLKSGFFLPEIWYKKTAFKRLNLVWNDDNYCLYHRS